MIVDIKDVSVEQVVNGRSRYSKATVKYSYNGEPRTQNIMSFSNPDVFKKVQELVGQTVDVELVKNDKGYTEWKNVSVGGSSGQSAGTETKTASTRVTGSNYETREERAARQVLIVKQSSLSSAIATLTPGSKGLNPDDVLALADRFTSWVLDTGEKSEDNVDDLPF